MNTEKFGAMASGLKDLISDYETCKSELAKLQLEELIVKYADILVRTYRGEKSEMACNCRDSENDDCSCA